MTDNHHDTPENENANIEKQAAQQTRDEYTLAFGWLFADLRGDEQAKATLFGYAAQNELIPGFVNSLTSVAIQAAIELSDGDPEGALREMQQRVDARLTQRMNGEL